MQRVLIRVAGTVLILLGMVSLVTSAGISGAASPASEGVTLVGQLAVTGKAGTTSTTIGNGAVLCGPPTAGAAVPRPTNDEKPTVTVSLGPTTASHCRTTFTDGFYDVMYCDGAMFKRTGGEWRINHSGADHGRCFFTDAVGDRAVLMGTLTVYGGMGSGEFFVPAGATKNGSNHAAAITVRRTGTDGTRDANIAPLAILDF